MSDKKLNWGILSTAGIARKNWKAIRNSGNGRVVAVASREESKARRFIQECQADETFDPLPRALGSYEALLADPGVDAVYIPLPTGLRQEWVVKAAQAGKHVVCEKPCGADLDQVKAMVAACRDHEVQFMDGVMFMHSLRLPRIREILDQGKHVGRLKRMSAHFSFCAPEDFLTGNIRMHSQLEPFGCLGDLGWYCLRFFLWVMQWETPREVTGRILSAQGREDSPDRVPMEFSSELFFGNGVSAGFYCSFLTENQQTLLLSGQRGYLEMTDFVLPFFGSEVALTTRNSIFQINNCEFNMEEHARRHGVDEYSNSHRNAQETHLFRNFADQVLGGKLNTDWPDMALQTQQVMEACLESARSGGLRAEVRGQGSEGGGQRSGV